MKIGIDFDKVLFDTEALKEHLEDRFPGFKNTYDKARDRDGYKFDRHAELLGVEKEQILRELEKSDKFIYDDIEYLNQLKEDNKLIIISRGDKRFQTEKIKKSGVLDYVDDYKIVSEDAKGKYDIDLLVDDTEKEIERTEIPGMLFDRSSDKLQDIEEEIRRVKREKVFKRYDIRGKYPEEIDEKFAETLGKAFGNFLASKGEQKVVVTRDNKKSSKSIKNSFITGLRSTGTDILDAGVGPTDYTAFSGQEKNRFSVQVTSSHLKLDFNGFKFMYPEGNGLLNEDLDSIKELCRERDFVEAKEGEIQDITDSMRSKYKEDIKGYFRHYFDSVDRKIVVETMGGASSRLLPGILDELGAEVIDLSSDTKEPSINPPDPKPENLEHLKQKVEDLEADLGLATDMDGDRVTAYCDGNWLNGNQIFWLLAKIIEPEKIVASVDSSVQLEKVVKSLGSEISYTRVGDPFVISEMLKQNAELSGEPNGHYCFKGFTAYNSGTLAALLLAGSDLSILEDIPERAVKKESVNVENKEERLENIKREVKQKYKLISEIDGVKYKTGKSTVLIRSSGSSPKLRIVVDSSDESSASKSLETAKNLIQKK